MKIVDFTNCPDGYRDYSGSDNKRSIEYQCEKYLLKLPQHHDVLKNELQTSEVNNVLSEYIGSHIVDFLGIRAHETILGTYKDDIAVACKDFTGEGYRLHEFSWMMRCVYDTSQVGKFPTYNQLYEVIQTHPLLKNIADQAISSYWDTFVADALIGNFDRHKCNWGYLVNEETKDVKIAPVYDCGSCLYPDLSEDSMRFVLDSREEIDKRIYKFPNVALNKSDKPKKYEKFSYLELLTPGTDKNATDALQRIHPRIDMDKIFKFIENIPVLSDTRIEFYEVMLQNRKELILDRSLEKVQQYAFNEKVEDIVSEIKRINELSSSNVYVDSDKREIILFGSDSEDVSMHIDVNTREVTPYMQDREISFAECMVHYPETMKQIQTVKATFNDSVRMDNHTKLLEEER